MKNTVRKLVTLAVLLSSCGGYQPGHGSDLACEYESICLSYIDGDRAGVLTSAVAHEISTSSPFTYTHTGGDHSREIEVVEVGDHPVGYRYDTNQNQQLIDKLGIAEGRLKATAQVKIYARSSGCCVAGPIKVSAAGDYDHDYYSHSDTSPAFSLGQLDDLDVARDAAGESLDKELAKKIVDYISNHWNSSEVHQ
jgi:hypothetical protein